MKKGKRPCRLRLRSSRAVAAALMALLLLTSLPMPAWAATGTNASAAPGPPRPAPVAARTSISVNRTVPSVTAPPLWPIFSARPTADEIRRARVFEEPLIPMGGRASAKENKALVNALLAYVKRSDGEDLSDVTQFLRQHPRSVWQAALLANLGLVYRSQGYFSRALAAWEEAWRLSKNETELEARALADRTAGELANLTARLGHDARLDALLQEVSGRALRGSATERITSARQALWQMRHPSPTGLSCGPYAVSRVWTALHPEASWQLPVASSTLRRSTRLVELQALAKAYPLDYRMARRPAGAPIPVPSVVHWKVGHYGALVKEEDGRYLLEDSALDRTGHGQAWVSRAALDTEASGYFLIAGGTLPPGWQAVSRTEGQAVWGKGDTNDNDDDATKPCDTKIGGSCPGG